MIHPQWVIQYDDGSSMQECSGDCTNHYSYADIRVNEVSILSWAFPDARDVNVLVPPDSIPVMFRRQAKEVDPSGQMIRTLTDTIYGLGYESSTGNSYLFILPNGSVVLSNNKNAVYL